MHDCVLQYHSVVFAVYVSGKVIAIVERHWREYVCTIAADTATTAMTETGTQTDAEEAITVVPMDARYGVNADAVVLL